MELHCNVHVVKVSEKQNTAAAGSAYIGRNRNEGHDGRIHDYTKDPGFVAGGFMLPENSPERWQQDPQKAWAEQDLIDYTKSTRRGPNSELYRAGTIGLAWAISHERAAELAEEIFEPLRDKGMFLQWAIHDEVDPKTKKRNYHIHWMSAMREVTPEGFGNKNRAWNKYNGGLNVPQLLRPRVASILNRELEALGAPERVEHESFEARGIDKIPQTHMGPAASALEKNRYKKTGELQREGIETNKGRRNRYIEWLNQIHAENLKEAEKHAGSHVRLEDQIFGAVSQKEGTEAFKDWEALFAMLRDTRRCRAALNGEIKKLDKILSAYTRMNEAQNEEERNKERSYIAWAGCDSDDEGWKNVIKTMQHQARIGIHQMDVTEEFLLDSKELYKAHNKVVYTAKKASWDQYQIDRNKRGIDYCERRLDSLHSYMDYIGRDISLLDIIFSTQAWKDYCDQMRELRQQEEELREEYARKRAELKQAKKDVKIHRKEAKQAEKEEKKVICEQKKKDRVGSDER